MMRQTLVVACPTCYEPFESYVDYQAHMPCNGPDTPPDEDDGEDFPWDIV